MSTFQSLPLSLSEISTKCIRIVDIATFDQPQSPKGDFNAYTTDLVLLTS